MACEGLTLVAQRELVRVSPIYKFSTGDVLRDLYYLVKQPNSKPENGICMNFCPMCGEPMEQGTPTC